MSSKIVYLAPTLHLVLVELQIDHFSIKDMVTHIELHLGGGYFAELSYHQIYNVLYRSVYSLIRKGLLSSYQDDAKVTRFAKTAQFSEKQFAIKPPRLTEEKGKAPPEKTEQQPIFSPKKIIEELEGALRLHAKNLQIALSEIEEYKQLFTQYPTLRTSIEASYQTATEQVSRLYGQVRAVETVLNQLRQGSSECC